MKIDHVTFAVSTLYPLQDAFAALGLSTDYGGPHSSGVTHMAQLSFDDGSYLELISTLKPGEKSQWWNNAIVGDAGPCAWAIGTGDVAEEARRINALGIPVDGPHHAGRTTSDGRALEWDSAFIGDGDPGSMLPFLIQDQTPREWRVSPSASVAGSELRGIGKVVLGVRDAVASARLFQTAYDWRTVHVAIDVTLGLNLLEFDDSPVILAAPAAPESPLVQRLGLFGDMPMAFLIETTDIRASTSRLPLGEEVIWFGKSIHWLPYAGLPQLGVIRGG